MGSVTIIRNPGSSDEEKIEKVTLCKLLLLYYEIQSTDTIKEGTVPVPSYRPCAER